MTRLILVRHGRSTWNAAHRIQGHADPPLDGVGPEDLRIEELATSLLALQHRGRDLRCVRKVIEPGLHDLDASGLQAP